jgi:hypothetical protein
MADESQIFSNKKIVFHPLFSFESIILGLAVMEISSIITHSDTISTTKRKLRKFPEEMVYIETLPVDTNRQSTLSLNITS